MKVLAPQKEEKFESLPGDDGKVDEKFERFNRFKIEVK